MEYFCLYIHVSEPFRDSITNFAFENNATGIQEVAGGIEIYFNSESEARYCEDKLMVYVADLEALNNDQADYSVEGRRLPEVNWNCIWQEKWKATRAGNFIIHPPWDKPNPETDLTRMEIHPRMAFGTGTHPTTRLLLYWIDKTAQVDCNILDVGCGSGILSIAAIKRGAALAMGIDIEQDAIDNARENAGLNGVTHETYFRRLEVHQLGPEYQFQKVFANIIFPVIDDLFSELVRLTLPGGELLVSGILIAEEKKLHNVSCQFPLKELAITREGEWSAVRYRRNPT